MAGVILENMSTKKILTFCGLLLILQVICFLVGGIIAPLPTNPNKNLATKCIDPSQSLRKSFVPWGKGACQKVADFEEAIQKQIPANSIVFSVRMPHIRFEMSKLFQFMVGVLTLEIEYDENTPMDDDPTIFMVITMAYNDNLNAEGEWTTLHQVNESRHLNCVLEEEPEPGAQYDCEPISLFELSSVHHRHYLINIRLPVSEIDVGNGEKKFTNENIGSIKDVNIVEIHQTGGFTIIWLTLKSVFFPLVLGMTLFFYRRVGQLGRPPLLMEKTIFSLAIVVSFLNFPMEWLTLVFEIPAMLLISDIRQGACYAMLFSFWVIFVGEHMMDSVQRNRLGAYWQQTVAIATACGGLLVFDLTERGSQLVNPFYSVWNSEQGAKIAGTNMEAINIKAGYKYPNSQMGFIILAAICVCIYFFSLLFMVFCVFRNLRMKSIAFNSMPKHRKKYYQGLVYRFRFFIIFSLFCALMTIIFFVMSQVSEVYSWHLDDEGSPRIHYTSAFFTGVYGLWNVYVLAVLFLYSPSHKEEPLLSTVDPSEGSQVEYEMQPTASTPMTASSSMSQAVSTPSEVYQLLGKTAAD